MPDLKIALANPNLAFIDLEQVGRAILLCFFCDIPLAIWGGPGIGKTSKVRQIAARLPRRDGGRGWKVYNLRLSDKDKSDIGGIPFPITVPNEKPGDTIERVKPYVEYLIAKGLLPFDTDEECILFIDEVDRTDDPGVKNAIQQVILDREVNLHILSPNCRIVLAGNGTSDIDTSELSRAANGRMIHVYVENESMGALDSWQEWAAEQVEIDPEEPDLGTQPRISDVLRAFAKSSHEIWTNGQSADQDKLKEQAEPTNRTWEYADKVVRASETITMYKTSDILLPIVSGCVGKRAATEFLGFRRDFGDIPTVEQVLSDPENTRVPERIDVFYMLTFSLTDHATRDRATAEAVAIYGLRWPEEPAAFLFRRLLEKQPSVATTDAFMNWAHKRRGGATTYAAYVHYEDELVRLFPGSIPRPENEEWVNRIEIPSKTRPTGKGYILSQSRSDPSDWRCACPGWTMKKPGQERTCEHIKRLPAYMYGNPAKISK